jgi:hypothetical protein
MSKHVEGDISPKSFDLANKYPMNIHYCKRTIPILEDLEKEERILKKEDDDESNRKLTN